MLGGVVLVLGWVKFIMGGPISTFMHHTIQLNILSTIPFQCFPFGASLVPSVEHNDMNRALVSSSMQRHTIPLSRSEKCVVGTKLEYQVALDSGRGYCYIRTQENDCLH